MSQPHSANQTRTTIPDNCIPDNCRSSRMSHIVNTDVLIIGAGLAGLSTALSLPKSLNITVLSKAALEVCSSHYAQGGIAASLDKDDSVSDHVADTLVAGAGLCTPDNTASILGAGQQAVQWLCAQGVPFTQNSPNALDNTSAQEFSQLQTSDLHLTKEGGHGCRRVAHADDATGRHVMDALTIKAQAATNITILPYHEALELLTLPIASSQPFFTNNSDAKYCRGALVFDHINGRPLTFHSRAVVLASGGLGQLFKRASAPNVCVGDGVMMAWQAGCRLANLEFIQFHPTGLALDDSSFLISEALRGEGGRLYCPKTGVRFMLDVDARAELAPRDIVARAIAAQIDNNGLGYVHLDVSHLPADFVKAHFPQIYQTLLTLGIDITTDPIPVAPTAHYSCGGVVTDANGLTDVPGLYAAGEVAYTGLHGANRLASNSLLECVVVGRNIADHLPQYVTRLANAEKMNNDAYRDINQSVIESWSVPTLTDAQSIILTDTLFTASEYDNDDKDDKLSGAEADMTKITAALKVLMTTNMGITRSAGQLEQALTQIQKWQVSLASTELGQQNIIKNDSPTNIHELAYFQLTRQLALATLIIQSAYQRMESRGGHYRHDYPKLSDIPRASVVEPQREPYQQHISAAQSINISKTLNNMWKTLIA
ncbi:L-aspartate oxidase [Psychrobacter pacificensis]|uniref:L-aspartate oxidase n=2 Tax=Psychrobacter pacificensis TaxID=112002 RepID=A0ABQ5YX66_9GAMM|nr:L-aspartate oxidase [Psychrobacter pacificensis]GLR28041.1 L-aspartate oxidase [Psychrobacter pacificensis]